MDSCVNGTLIKSVGQNLPEAETHRFYTFGRVSAFFFLYFSLASQLSFFGKYYFTGNEKGV